MTAIGRLAFALPAAACLLASAAPAVGAEAVTRRETSLALRACERPARTILREYAGRDLGVVQCSAPRGFTLLLVSSDANSWLDLRRGKLGWSSEQAVVYREGAGMFPNITGTVVWLRDVRGWRGLVFAVASRDEADARHLAYFAVRTDRDRICLAGVFPARRAAEAAVRADQGCGEEPAGMGTSSYAPTHSG